MDLVYTIREELKNSIDEKVRLGYKRFFKEEVKFYGIKTPIVIKTARHFYSEINVKSKQDVFSLCDELFKSGYCEEAFIACDWSFTRKNEFEKSDFQIFESWIKQYVTNWAVCDTFCTHTMGYFIEKYPEFINELKKWSKSENMWARRASAVSMIVSARKGKFIEDVFNISDILMKDSEDLVQKGYGWLLKEASKARQKDVYDYVLFHKKEMPRTALRYAIEKMPKEMKKVAMGK